MDNFNFNFLITKNRLLCLFQVRLINFNTQVHTFCFTEITPAPKPISNGKSKIFLNKPDDSSSDEDDNERPSLSEK